jgi:DNA-binding response OmpR family regulator
MSLAGTSNRAFGGRSPAYILLVIQVQDICVDPEARRAWRGEDEIKLSRKEFDLLYKLISNAGTIVSRDELMQDVWATRFWTSSKTIDVHLGWVRRKIGDDSRHPHLITTIRGKGLRFEPGPVPVA